MRMSPAPSRLIHQSVDTTIVACSIRQPSGRSLELGTFAQLIGGKPVPASEICRFGFFGHRFGRAIGLGSVISHRQSTRCACERHDIASDSAPPIDQPRARPMICVAPACSLDSRLIELRLSHHGVRDCRLLVGRRGWRHHDRCGRLIHDGWRRFRFAHRRALECASGKSGRGRTRAPVLRFPSAGS